MDSEIFYRNKNAVAILRVSSKGQKDGSSHSVQDQRTKEYCEEMGLKLVKTFVITESAKKSQDRVKYHDAMEFVKANKCGNVVFYMPDRESRNMTDIEENQESVINGEFNIHYVSERKILHRDSATTDFMSREFAGLISRDFIRVLRKRIIDAMARKAETGWWPSNHPALGYVCVKNIDPETGKVKNRGTTIGLDPNENNRKIVLPSTP